MIVGVSLFRIWLKSSSRLKGKKSKELREAYKELQQDIGLINPSVLKRDPSLALPIKVKITKKQAQAQPMEEWA